MTSKDDRRKGGLTTVDMYHLDGACRLIKEAFNEPPYLVGSAMTDGDFRDVDVRLIIPDEEFDRLFRGQPRQLWELLSLAIGEYLRQRTELPIDFQIQRQSEANAKHQGVRNPLGMCRVYAGGGDATPDALLLPDNFPWPEPDPEKT